MDMKLYRTVAGAVVETDGSFFFVPDVDWGLILNRTEPASVVNTLLDGLSPIEAPDLSGALPPIGKHDVWAAGVTYRRSRSARMQESEQAGGDVFYDRVYDAERPELFYKSGARAVVGHGETVRIRADSTWDVPEPELALVINSEGTIVGYTIGNDMSSRSIEGENPLYLPQAKVYDRACALGPCVLLTDTPPGPETGITLTIQRGDETVFEGNTSLADMKRSLVELAEFLYRETSFPDGSILMTGTGVVPDPPFTLGHGDVVRITIDRIGTLENQVE